MSVTMTSHQSSLSGKVAIITGASSGIGRSISIKLASQGCRLALAGRNYENLEITKAQCIEQGLSKESILLVTADMNKQDDVKRLFDESIKHYNQLDILVNNAGIVRVGEVDEMDMSDYYQLMQVNVHSVVELTRLAVPYLEKTKGSVVIVSSINGVRPFPGKWAYSMTKSAIDQFTRCLSMDLAPRGIRINNVNPGVIVTPIAISNGLATEDSYKKFCEHSRSTHALQKVGDVSEVASVVSFLVSDKAVQTTGATFLIDGGRAAMAFPEPVMET